MFSKREKTIVNNINEKKLIYENIYLLSNNNILFSKKIDISL